MEFRRWEIDGRYGLATIRSSFSPFDLDSAAIGTGGGETLYRFNTLQEREYFARSLVTEEKLASAIRARKSLESELRGVLTKGGRIRRTRLLEIINGLPDA